MLKESVQLNHVFVGKKMDFVANINIGLGFGATFNNISIES